MYPERLTFEPAPSSVQCVQSQMSLTRHSFFTLLSQAPFGVYAVSPDQTILFWNQEAERMLGYSSEEVTGRRCYEVMSGPRPAAFTAACSQGCPSMASLRSGRPPRQAEVVVVGASGERKELLITPVIVSETGADASMIVHLFTEQQAGAEPSLVGVQVSAVSRTPDPADAPDEFASPGVAEGAPRLTARELEVLHLVSMGWETPRIASELNISPHTALNHIRHFRRKLNAPTKLIAVITAIRLGILPLSQ